MRIGYIENTIGNRYILFWFYRKDEDGVWRKIWTEEVPIGFRDQALNKIERRDGKLEKLELGCTIKNQLSG